MPDFTHGDLSCDFTNTLTDDIAVGVYLAACGLPVDPPRDKNNIVLETPVRSWQRAFCIIAAHVKNVQGIDWQPPTSPFDVTIGELRRSRDQFFACFGADQSNLVADWSEELYDHLNGKKTLVSDAEQTSGDKDTDFLGVSVAHSSGDAT